MTKSEVDLCCLIIEDLFGSLSALIFKTIARWGRISRPSLVNKCDLISRHVNYGLTVLLQQHLVLYHDPASEHDKKSGKKSEIFYEINVIGAYECLRRGKLLTYVEDRLGEKARDVLFMLMQHGHAKVSTLEETLVDLKSSKNTDARADCTVNGELNASATDMLPQAQQRSGSLESMGDLHESLWTLIQHGYISKVHDRSFWPVADYISSLEEQVKAHTFPDGKISGPRAKKSFHNAVVVEKRKWAEEEDDVKDHIQHRAKRQKTNGDMTNGVTRQSEDSGVKLAGNLVLMISDKKCSVNMRSERLAQYVTKALGDATGRVYEQMLSVVDQKIKTTKAPEELINMEKEAGDDTAEEELQTTTIAEVVKHLMQNQDAIGQLGFDLDSHESGNHKPSGKRKHENAYDSRNSGDLAGKLQAELLRHTNYLRSQPTPYLKRVSQNGHGEFGIPVHELTTTLRHNEIESLVTVRFGSVAARIIRLLRSKGKLDEKLICTFGMLRLREARPILTELHEHGFVESQEVPKDNSRQPTRSMYLWYYDGPRVERLMLERSYKAMTRCMQRIAVQRDAARHVIQKAERTDVEGHEDEFLTKQDKLNLQIWRDQEERLLCQIARMDETVALFRDF